MQGCVQGLEKVVGAWVRDRLLNTIFHNTIPLPPFAHRWTPSQDVRSSSALLAFTGTA